MASPSKSATRLAGCLLLASLSVSCGSFSKWGATDEFVGRLGCGMSKHEVAEVVDRYRGCELREVGRSEPWELVAVKGTTMIDLDFDADGLTRVRVSWIDAPAHRMFLPEQDLCSGQL